MLSSLHQMSSPYWLSCGRGDEHLTSGRCHAKGYRAFVAEVEVSAVMNWTGDRSTVGQLARRQKVRTTLPGLFRALACFFPGDMKVVYGAQLRGTGCWAFKCVYVLVAVRGGGDLIHVVGVNVFLSLCRWRVCV